MTRLMTLLAALAILHSAQGQTCASALREDSTTENVVKIVGSQIMVNGKAQPNLYGAEFQYFRLRGGYGRGVPREEVLAIWQRGLDQMVKAGMNSISFYIPWDFHEYAPGKFDFTGTIDGDGDGKADYPSRDILTFLKMVEAHGIKKIMIRPGPYVNAEWGFLGFGAVPEWFHDQYPDSHMQNSHGFKTKLYDYHNEDFLRHTRLWFEELNRQVLVHVLGKDKPGIFLQLENETNLQWQSIYNHDYGPHAVSRYQQMMKNKYRNLGLLNKAQATQVQSWKEVLPPTVRGVNLVQDQDWYRFQDKSIVSYLHEVRAIWESLGVREPNVMFTTADSYNAAQDGLLPTSMRGRAPGLRTINIYPKTWPSAENVLFHQPFKSTLDVLLATNINAKLIGGRQEAVVGPEIHTGWFGKTVLSKEARQQTYLTLLGRGMKALYFYYFNEGDNWQVEWGRNKIQPYYEVLHKDPRFSKFSRELLPDAFWQELQAQVDRQFMVGWNVKHVMLEDLTAAQKLAFDAPLDGQAKPTQHFELIAEIGQKIIRPYGEFLSRSVSLKDRVAIISDSGSHVPSPITGVDSRVMHSDFAGGLIGYIAQAGLNPSIHHWGINSVRELGENQIIFVQDSGNLNPQMVQWLARYISRGGTVVSFVGDSVAQAIGAPTAHSVSSQPGALAVTYDSVNRLSPHFNFEALASSVSEYRLVKGSASSALFKAADRVLGYQHRYGSGTLIQMGAVFYDAFNTGAYAFLEDVPQRRAFLDDLILEHKISPQLRIPEGGDRFDVFARKAPNDERLWITVKSGRLEEVQFHVQVNPSLVERKNSQYLLQNVLTGESQRISGERLISQGFPVTLPANGSAAFLLSPL